MSELPVRRRLDRTLVRAQARLEAGNGDRFIPFAVTLGLAAVLASAGLARVESLATGVDLAGYSQALWLLGRGNRPEASLFGSGVHLLELHWSFVLYPLALVGRLTDPARLLMVTQAVALSATVLPLWWLARRVAKLRIGAATAVVLTFALHPATHALGTADFQPEAMAVPAIVAMAYFGATRKWVGYWLCIALALACRADLGLAIGLWGFVVLGNRHRTVALWTLGIGFVWSLGLLMVLQPLVSDGGMVVGSFGIDGSSLSDQLLTSARSPVETIQALLDRENIELLVALLAPLIFLPLLSLRHLVPALPLAVIYLIADIPVLGTEVERAAMLLAFMIIAAPMALNRLGNMGVDRVFLDVRILTTLLAAAVLTSVASSPISPYERPWQWGRLDATDEAILAAVAMLDDETPVRASPSALVSLSERPWLFTLDPDAVPTAAQAAFPGFTRAVLLVEREIPEWSDVERLRFDRGMESLGFEVVLDDPAGVTLYTRS
ncbi:MAG: DUF2079 domain-containing protein [Acidimicrobiales bacterium]